MGSQTDYFERIGYKPRYWIGDRVIGTWKKIPFIGTVGNDTLISEEQGPRISVMLDLPIKHEDKVHTIIICKHRDIRKLPEWNEKSSVIKKPKKAGKKS